MNRYEVQKTLNAHRDRLAELDIRSLSLFGSVARGESRDDSDVDLLVEFSRPVGLFHFARTQRELSNILGRPVDLATPGALKPALRERILKESVRAA